MISFKKWRTDEDVQNIEWNHIKSLKLPVNPELKAFITPRIGKIQEAIVLQLSQSSPNVKSFRDVPPDIRDQYAQAIVAATLETFFGGMNPTIPNQPQVPIS